MPGLNASLYLGLSGLQAQQAALNVVGHNIANVNTPGYTRQRADLTSSQSLIEGQVYFGTGVTLNTVQGIRDRFLDLQIYRETARQTGAEDRYAGVDAVSSIVGDTGDTGIGAQIQAFFQGFQELSARPEDGALRTNLIGKAQTMIAGLQTRYRLLADQRDSADRAVGSLVTEVNTLTAQIAQLNQQISSETAPGANNDARDQRKALTDKLAGLVGINVFEGSKGEYQITLDSGAAVLVSGSNTYELHTTMDATLDGHLRVESLVGGSTIDVTAGIKEGQLGAKLDLRDTILVGFQRQLDQIAAGVAGQVNKLHRSGFGADGLPMNTNNDFFTTGVANDPITGLPVSGGNFYKGMVDNLAVSASIIANPGLIAAAGSSGAQGDNTNALAMAKLQLAGSTVDTNGDGAPDAGPFSTMVGSLISDVGTQAQKWKTQGSTQQNLVSALQTQRDRLSGVDLDEEAANMMTLQRGYQASGRFLSVINGLTDQLVNQFGK
ncbi:MAG TPA: flagellar hook-associated protein FlgK [Geothrix sp.]|jgi:flagellar hook-associated protein 1 FlgK